MQCQKCRMRKGFTLIELLVVLVIIIIMVSMLLPAVIRVRERAHIAGCIGKLKQVGIAFTNYANDYKAWLPLIQVNVDAATYVGATTRGGLASGEDGFTYIIKLKYFGSYHLLDKQEKARYFQCPSDRWNFWMKDGAQNQPSGNYYSYYYYPLAKPGFSYTEDEYPRRSRIRMTGTADPANKYMCDIWIDDKPGYSGHTKNHSNTQNMLALGGYVRSPAYPGSRIGNSWLYSWGKWMDNQ